MAHGNKAVWVAALANAGIAVAKLVGYSLTGATSMLAEAVHSLADAGNQGLLLLGAARGARRATKQHPFGYGRERYFWAFVVAMTLFLLGSVYALYEGIHKVMAPEPIKSPTIAVAILAFATALEAWSFRTAIREAAPLCRDKSWWTFIRHTRQAELPVVLLEDMGALLGLAIALLGVLLTIWTGDPRYDGLGSIVIGLLLGGIAVVLAIEMQSLLIGESANPAIESDIRRALEDGEDLQRVIHMRTLHLGPDELLVAAKVEVSGDPLTSSLTARIDRAEARVRAQVPIARVIYLEPDLYKPEPE